MHPWEFDQYSFDEFIAKREGYWKHFKDGKIIDFRHLQITISQLMRMQVDKKYQNLPIDRFIPDIYSTAPVLTIEEKKERQRKILDRARRIKPKNNGE